MAFKVDLIRPNDLLNLQVEGRNLQLDLGAADGPALVPEDAGQAAYLIVTFPPQTIAEEAIFEASGLLPPPAERGADSPANQPPPAFPSSNMPSQARARLAGPSRLVFRFAANSSPRIPFTIEGLLNWKGLELSVSALAGIPAEPDAGQRQNAPRIAPPRDIETAIEIPYRLTLSPHHEVTWKHSTAPVSYAGRSELWHTRLALPDESGEPVEISKTHPAPLRAIWSPDYQPAQSNSPEGWPGVGVPDRWAGRLVLTAMNQRDRHELVILTSNFKNYIKGKRDSRTYEPKPIYAEQVMLSALGGFLKSRGSWDPPVEWLYPAPIFRRAANLDLPPAAQDAGPGLEHQLAFQDVDPLRDLLEERNVAINDQPPWLPPILRGEPGQPLNISEWVHVATQGRDHYVRIVYEGFLYPFGHRAALVKVTERKFRDVNGTPFAYLAQRMFIVVRQPLMVYNQGCLSYEGRGMPLKQVRLTTLVTPDINFPAPIVGTGYSFWVQVAGQDFKFHAAGLDSAGHLIDFTTALIFIPNSDTQDVQPSPIQAVRNAYNASGSRRLCQVPGQLVTYAEPGPVGEDHTTLITSSLIFDTTACQESPFIPTMTQAAVNLAAIEQLLGRATPTDIRYFSSYLSSGFDAHNGVFAQLVNKVSATFSADKGGGIATPDLSVTGLARKLGPVAGDLTKVANDDFQPADFFNDVAETATLFGKLKLAELILPGDFSKAPKVRQFPKSNPPAVCLDWQPDIASRDIGFLKFQKGQSSTLKIEGLVEQPLDGLPGRSRFYGELTDFALEFLRVVRLSFDSFRFTSETGKKTEVNVQLKPGDQALEFLGDLKFVNELKKIIPSSLFGDGPSLEITPQPAIRAGFSIGLPPVAIGIFALKDVSLGAYLTLPFLNGSPLFDFNVSERARPFNLTVAFFGGGGFFHLQVDTQAVRIVEASFEFGASASINLGVASGGVYIMAGIYFKLETKPSGDKAATLSGFFRMGGELSVLGLISVSLEFYLSFTYESGQLDANGNELPGKATGRATLTVKVEVLFFSTSVEITVEKKFGGQNGDPTFGEVWDEFGIWNEYAGAFA